MGYGYITVDVFTDRMFGGNPLAVFPDARGLTGEEMQAITREFNYSESTFVLPPENPSHAAKVRIFTPGREIPFAGHPTVGTAYVLAKIGAVKTKDGDNLVVLEEGVGPVPVKVSMQNGEPVSMQFSAAKMPEFAPAAPSIDVLAEVLGLEPEDFAIDIASPQSVSCGLPFLFALLRDEEAVARAECNLSAFRKHLADNQWTTGIFLFNRNSDDADAQVHARMFAPLSGVAEDPATGSAATALAGYLVRCEAVQDGTKRWTVEQGVEMGRPSRIEVECDVEAGVVKAIRVLGKSVLVTEGQFHIG